MSTAHTLRIPEETVTLIRKMHPHLKRKIRAALNKIIHDPNCGKLLKLELAGLTSYQVSRFRIIYRVNPEHMVELVAVGPRRIIYEETYRLVKDKKS